MYMYICVYDITTFIQIPFWDEPSELPRLSPDQMLAFGAKAAWGQHNAHPDLSDDEAKTTDVRQMFKAVPNLFQHQAANQKKMQTTF